KGLEQELAKLASVSVLELQDENSTYTDGDTVTIAGLITGVQHRVARTSGNPFGQVSIEDFGGEISVMFLGRSYKDFHDLLVPDTIAGLEARVQSRDDGVSLHAKRLTQPRLKGGEEHRSLVIDLVDTVATTKVVTELGAMLRRHPGENEVKLRLHTPQSIR